MIFLKNLISFVRGFWLLLTITISASCCISIIMNLDKLIIKLNNDIGLSDILLSRTSILIFIFFFAYAIMYVLKESGYKVHRATSKRFSYVICDGNFDKHYP